MKYMGGAIVIVLLAMCAGAAPDAPPNPAVLAFAKPLIAEADKCAVASGDSLADAPERADWLDAHIRANDWEAAKALIEAAPQAKREDFYTTACTEAASVGRVKLAEQILDEHLKSNDNRDSGVVAIAIADAKQGNIDDAIAEMKKLTDPKQRFTPLMEVAMAQQRAGDHAAAGKTCDDLVAVLRSIDSSLPNFELGQTVRTMAAAGQTDAAKKLLVETKDDMKQAIGINRIAEGQAMAGDMDGFVATRATLRKLDQSEVCLLPGLVLCERGDVAGAQKLLGYCEISTFSDPLRVAIGSALIRTGKTPDALAMVSAMDDPIWKLKLYYQVIRAQSLAGDKNAAESTVALARKTANTASDDFRSDANLLIADAQAAMGDPKGAIAAIAAAVPDQSKTMEAYCTAAKLAVTPP